ncbi:MAG: hypothetical protein KGL36_01330 [Gammaproteobacteria bacterium]|nr:hypothetical protein [Gammaproteobacteria bacterium]
MRRSDLEHVIRAAGAIANDPEIIVIGSQSILGSFPEAPGLLVRSIEADVYPLHHPERADLIDGAIGEGSAFHELFGYYAQGVGEDTAILPAGWRDRLVPVNNANTNGVTGLCLEIHDLAISKYVAGREKDREFTRELAKRGLTGLPTLLKRLDHTELSDELRAVVKARMTRDFPSRSSKPTGAV